MKKTILISIGVIIILAVIGLWVYLFIYGAPEKTEGIFARFGVGGEAESPMTPVEITDSVVDVRETNGNQKEQKLRQLTTRPVAGANLKDTTLYYVEQGTGHIYSINLESGAETLVNGSTYPKAVEAVFSENGSYVAITTFGEGSTKTVVEPVAMNESEEGILLPDNATDIGYDTTSRTFVYTIKSTSGTTGFSYNIETKKSTPRFTVPLRDIRVLWGKNTHAYTTPTASMLGYLYAIDGNSLQYVTSGGYSLMGLVYTDGVVSTRYDGTGLQSLLIPTKGPVTALPVPLIPEKCASSGTIFYCGIPQEDLAPKNFPDAWYKGTLTYSDRLWMIDANTGVATALSNIESISGREVDVLRMYVSGSILYFINKNDNTLWMYDMT